LRKTLVTGEGMKTVGSFGKLAELSLEFTQVSAEGLRHLEGLQELRRLGCHRSRIDDEGRKRLVEAIPGLHVDFTE
jgi:hypothetical protein